MGDELCDLLGSLSQIARGSQRRLSFGTRSIGRLVLNSLTSATARSTLHPSGSVKCKCRERALQEQTIL